MLDSLAKSVVQALLNYITKGEQVAADFVQDWLIDNTVIE